MLVKIDQEKYARRASAAGQDYAQGTQSPRRSQSESAIAASKNYEAGIAESIAQKSFEKGLRKAGDAKWQKGVQEKGRARYQQGVSVAGADWSTAMQPFSAALNALTLEPRGPKGQNYGRTQKVGDALRAAKKASS